MSLWQDFQNDAVGRKFADMKHEEFFGHILYFFSDEDRQRRMRESEVHHRRPALAGVVMELERQFQQTEPDLRKRQLVGAIVGFIMRKHGWRATGKRGFMKGLSKWLTRAEHFETAFVPPAREPSEALKRYYERRELVAVAKKMVAGRPDERAWLEKINAVKTSIKVLRRLVDEIDPERQKLIEQLRRSVGTFHGDIAGDLLKELIEKIEAAKYSISGLREIEQEILKIERNLKLKLTFDFDKE